MRMNTQEIIQAESDYIVHTYVRPGIVFSHGEGMYLFDTTGKQYLDFTSGIAVTALGHSDPEWVSAVRDQAGKLVHVSNLYHTEPHAALARRLVENSFAEKVYFCNSGAEANEAAIKFARKYAKLTISGQEKSETILSQNIPPREHELASPKLSPLRVGFTAVRWAHWLQHTKRNIVSLSPRSCLASLFPNTTI